MLKNILKILAVFIIGMIGGIFADQILWPYFIERPLFYQYRLEQSPIYVTEKKEIIMYVQENVALREAIEKVEKAVIGVKTETVEGEILEGSGIVVTSDGFVVTLASIAPFGSDFAFFVDGKWPSYQILKRDLKNDLALIKVEDRGLSVTGFSDLEKVRVGERVFLISMDFDNTGTTTEAFLPPQKMVNEGIITLLGEDLIQTNIFDTSKVQGSPLFNIEGNLIGLSLVDEDGRVSAIPVTFIRPLIGL